MKTRIFIETTDEERNQLACFLDGAMSKRMVSRKEIIALCEQHMGGLIEQCVHLDPPEKKEAVMSGIYILDKEDAHMLKDKSPGYIRGWNSVKRSK